MFKKQIKFYLNKLVIILGLASFSVLVFSFNSVASASGVCYIQQSGVAYQCGPNTSSVCTPFQIIPVNNNNKPINPNCPTNASWYAFTDGACYSYDIDPHGVPSWLQAADCSGAVYQSPLSTAIPDTINSQDQAINCSANSNSCDLVTKYVNPLVRALSYAVGIVIVISIVIGGIQFSSSGDNPQAAAAAKKRIFAALIAAVTYLFLMSILQFFLPGGVI